MSLLPDQLRREFRDDPESLYGDNLINGNAQALLAAINAGGRSFKTNIQKPKLVHFGRKNGRLQKCKYASEFMDGTPLGLPNWSASGTPPTLDQAASCAVALGVFSGNVRWFDPNYPDDVAIIQDLVDCNVLTAAERDEFLALADVTGSRAEELGLVEMGEAVMLGHVNQAITLTIMDKVSVSAANPAQCTALDGAHRVQNGQTVQFRGSGNATLDRAEGWVATVVDGDDLSFHIPWDNSAGSIIDSATFVVLD